MTAPSEAAAVAPLTGAGLLGCRDCLCVPGVLLFRRSSDSAYAAIRTHLPLP